MDSPVVWMKGAEVFKGSAMLAHSCSLQRCSMGPLLRSSFSGEGAELYNVHHALGTVVLSGMGSIQYVPALVGMNMYSVGAGSAYVCVCRNE